MSAFKILICDLCILWSVTKSFHCLRDNVTVIYVCLCNFKTAGLNLHQHLNKMDFSRYGYKDILTGLFRH